MPSRPDGLIHFRSRAPGQVTLQTRELEGRNEDLVHKLSILSWKRPTLSNFKHAARGRGLPSL